MFESEKYKYNFGKGYVNIGRGWTPLSAECWTRRNLGCEGCVYYKYCKTTYCGIIEEFNPKKHPILRKVVVGLFARYGKPPRKMLRMLSSS